MLQDMPSCRTLHITSQYHARDLMDFTSLYSTRIQATFDDDLALILKTFQEQCTQKQNFKVTITNYHKGLPITYPATVLGVDRGSLDLDVNGPQAVAIANDRYTLIRSKLFPHTMVAFAQYVNIRKHIVSLNKLCFVEVLAEKRTAVRLDMDPPTRSVIQYDQQKINGELISISTQGIAVSADSYVEAEVLVDSVVKFLLPDETLMKQTLVSLKAKLVTIVGNSAPYRYAFKIEPEKHQEQLISRFSFRRQVEIIRSLKELAE